MAKNREIASIQYIHRFTKFPGGVGAQNTYMNFSKKCQNTYTNFGFSEKI